ncbi:hypothetical protein TNCV_800691 [Trichonephila clavipes]|nr:hypothetical protein TNCV_800691 [Trichonephila clavipes]
MVESFFIVILPDLSDTLTREVPQASLNQKCPTSQEEEKSLLIFRGPVWKGFVLESATSSGPEEPPALQCRTPSRHHLELQDRRDYTPADRAARTCWLGCPGSCTISGSLRRKTQLFSCTPLHGRFLQDPTLTSPKVLKSSKPRSKCQISQEAVRCVIIPKSEKPSDTTSFHSKSWSATGLRGRK